MRTKMQRRVSTLSLLPLFFAGVAFTGASAQDFGQARELPDSPSAATRQIAGMSGPFQEQTAPAAQPSQAAVQSSEPVGTAAAERPAPIGVAASNPAGAAIAPPTQRRARMLFIKVGLVVGASVAVGTVAALSMSGSAKPPGSH